MLSLRVTNLFHERASLVLCLSFLIVFILAIVFFAVSSPQQDVVDFKTQQHFSVNNVTTIQEYDGFTSISYDNENLTIPDILCIRIQKSGSTSFRFILQQLGKHVTDRRDFKIAEPRWRAQLNANTGHFQIYTGHVFFKPYMLKPEYWKLKQKPLLLTLLRLPFPQFYSQFRYRVQRCHVQAWQRPNEVDRLACRFGFDFASFAEYFCENEVGKQELFCNQETQFTQGDLLAAEDIVRQYDLVLLLERFRESLALLHVLHNLPIRHLFNFHFNENSAVPASKVPVSKELQLKLETEWLLPDQRLYQAANQIMDEKIQQLSAQQRSRFEWHLRKQVLFDEKCLEIPCKTKGRFLLDSEECETCIRNLLQEDQG